MISFARNRLLRPALLGAALVPALLADPASAATPLDHPPTLTTFKLADTGSPSLSMLRAYFDAEVERPGPYNRYVGGQYGRWFKSPRFSLAWGIEHAEDDTLAGGTGDDAASGTSLAPADLGAATLGDERTFTLPSAASDSTTDSAPAWKWLDVPAPSALSVHIDPSDWSTRLIVASDRASSENPFRAPFWSTGPSLSSNGYGTLWAPATKPVTDWRCRRRPVLFIRYGGVSDRFSLVQCNGAVEPGAVDRLSILVRPPEVPDPGELPDEPDPTAWEKDGEWLPRVKLVNPRLLWLLQKIADAFPHRAIYVYSGYRPHPERSNGQGHQSQHGEGRAMDIQVHGVRNESLFQYCRKLDDVGCGYYPNSKFVHVDVRRPGTGHAFWIDISGPGEPSHYVDSWPGVIDHGALAWMQVPQKIESVQGARPRTPDERGAADLIRK